MALHPVSSGYANNSQMCICLWKSPLVSGLKHPMADSTYSLWWLVDILCLTCPKLSPFFPKEKKTHCCKFYQIMLLTIQFFQLFRRWFWESYWLYFLSYTLPNSFCPTLKKHPDSENFLPSLFSVPRYDPQFPFTWILAVSSYLSSLLSPYCLYPIHRLSSLIYCIDITSMMLLASQQFFSGFEPHLIACGNFPRISTWSRSHTSSGVSCSLVSTFPYRLLSGPSLKSPPLHKHALSPHQLLFSLVLITTYYSVWLTTILIFLSLLPLTPPQTGM